MSLPITPIIRANLPPLELRGVVFAAWPPDAPELTHAFAPGTLTAVQGEPAASRHALLRCLDLQEPPARGELLIGGDRPWQWSDQQRADFRSLLIGHVLPAPFLLPALTVAENIAVPIFRLSQATPEEAAARSEELLEHAGLLARSQTSAGELPPAEQYAVAIIRALAHRPLVLLVEELDHALEGESVRQTAALLRRLAEVENVAVIATVSSSFPVSACGEHRWVLPTVAVCEEAPAAPSPRPTALGMPSSPPAA